MSYQFNVRPPVGRVIRSDFTSSGYLKGIYVPALVMFTTKTTNYATIQLQMFADTYTIQCYVGYPMDGTHSDELALKEILAQAVGKSDIRFPTYILYGATKKSVYDYKPLSASALNSFVENNIN